MSDEYLFDHSELANHRGAGAHSLRVLNRGRSYLFGKRSGSAVKFEKGLRERPELLEMGRLIVAGYPNNYIANKLQVGRKTVRLFRLLLEAQSKKKFMCPCGRPPGHREYCPRAVEIFPNRLRLTPEKVAYIRQKHRFRTYGCVRLARELDLNVLTVRKALRGKFYPNLPNARGTRSFDRPLKERIRERFKSHYRFRKYTFAMLAREFGVDWHFAYRACKGRKDVAKQPLKTIGRHFPHSNLEMRIAA